MSRNHRLALTGLVLVGALGLAGCGGSNDSAASTGAGGSGSANATASAQATPETPTAAALYPKMKAVTQKARNARFTATGGKGSDVAKIDFTGDQKGTNISMIYTTASDGTAQARVVDGKAWIKGDQKYWTAVGAKSAAATIAGKWTTVPPSKLTTFNDAGLNRVLTEYLMKNAPTSAELAKGKITADAVDGVKAWKLTGFDGATKNTIWIAAEGDPFPVRLLDAKNAVDVRFSQWNSAPTVDAPPASDVVGEPTKG